MGGSYVRRLVVFARVFACLLVGVVRLADAQTDPHCNTGGSLFATRQAAFANCEAQGAQYMSHSGSKGYSCFGSQCRPGVDAGSVSGEGYPAFGDPDYFNNSYYSAGCPAAGQSDTDGNGNVETTSGFLTNGSVVCKLGCNAIFSPGSGVGVGAGGLYLNPGRLIYDGTQCNGGPDAPPGKPQTPNPAPTGPCSGPFCYTPPDSICDQNTGICVHIQPPNSFNPSPTAGAGGCGTNGVNCAPSGSPPGPGPKPDCGSDSSAADCIGNPPPPPPNPPCGTNASPSGSGHFDSQVGKFDAQGYDPCNPPPNSCPFGTRLVDGNCVPGCPPGQININGTCTGTCPAGQTLQNGSCVTVCPAGQVLSGTQCVSTCPSGTVSNGAGGCTGVCPAGQVMVNGACQNQCPSGQSYTNGGCSSSCPSGTTSSGGVCQPNSCPPGQVASGGSCVAQCPPGQTAQNGACVQGNSASGGTDCGAPPVCSGDQILCNIDLQDWKQNCPGKWPDGDPKADLAAQPTSGASAFTDGETTPTFDNSGFLGGSGACVQFDPISFSVGSQSATLDLSNSSWCLVSQLLGALVLLVAYFKAGQIILRG